MANYINPQAAKIIELVLVYFGDAETAFIELKGVAESLTGIGLVTALSEKLHFDSSAATSLTSVFMDKRSIEKQEFFDVFARVSEAALQAPREELFPIWEHVRRLLGLDGLGLKKLEVPSEDEEDWTLHSYTKDSFNDDQELDLFEVSVPSMYEIKDKYSEQFSSKVSRTPRVRLQFPQSSRHLTAMEELKATYLTTVEDLDQSIFATKDPVEILKNSSNKFGSQLLKKSRLM